MIKKLLSFRHWQLFLLIFICGAWTSPSPLKEIINSIAVISFTLWIYAIGVYGQERIAEAGLPTMKPDLFKTNVWLVGAFFLSALAYSAWFGVAYPTNNEAFGLKDFIHLFWQIYLAFAMIHTIIFACKTIAILEHKREVSFGDYVNNLLLMIFFFVGIWFLQPKVNKLIAEREVAL